METENQICADPKCGHKREEHSIITFGERCYVRDCPCKKFEASRQKSKISVKPKKGCGKEIDQDHGTPVYCGMIIIGILHLCPNCKPKNHDYYCTDCKGFDKKPHNHSPSFRNGVKVKDTPEKSNPRVKLSGANSQQEIRSNPTQKRRAPAGTLSNKIGGEKKK